MNKRNWHFSTLPFHPFLVAVFPVLSLYVHNMQQSRLAEIVLPLAFAIVVALLGLSASWVLLRSLRGAAMATSAFLLVFFSYGHLYLALRSLLPSRHLIVGIALAWVGMLLLVAVVLLVRRTGELADKMSKIANVVSFVGVLVLLVSILAFELRRSSQIQSLERETGLVETGVGAGSSDSLRDIYYIVMDRYPNLETLRDIYGYDNSPFIDYLRSAGFYVALGSRCNYARTDMSLPSSLNMTYINEEVDSCGEGSSPEVLRQMIQDHRLWRFLESRGYSFVHLGTQWGPTGYNSLADLNINRLLLSDFAMTFYKTTALYPLGAALGFDRRKEQWRRVLCKFDLLPRLPDSVKPRFVFAHFLLPHEPYVFSPQGRFVSRFEQMQLGEERGFVNQLLYANHRLMRCVDALLSCAGPKPIVVLQADEGPHPPENFSSRSDISDLRARFGILNACFLPSGDTTCLYQSITPVNTFRVILNQYFGTDMDLLADRCYDYDDGCFIDVTARVRSE